MDEREFRREIYTVIKNRVPRKNIIFEVKGGEFSVLIPIRGHQTLISSNSPEAVKDLLKGFKF